MLEALKEEVLAANLALPAAGLVTLTWGNVSGIDRARGLVVIKPSGVPYERLTADDLVVVDLEGAIVEGALRPSSDTPTHLELYRAFEGIGAVIHTHSTFATSWAQARHGIPCYGTTHADAFHGEIPCLAPLSAEEIEADYEVAIGRQITSEFARRGLDPLAMSAVLCACHGPFVWGVDVDGALSTAITLEEVAKMALLTEAIAPEPTPAPEALQEKHYERKHGAHAYYGQR